VVIAQQMPDPVAGATPIAYANWNQAYTVVNRKAVTMMQDPYSAGFCVLCRFEARVGGSRHLPECGTALAHPLTMARAPFEADESVAHLDAMERHRLRAGNIGIPAGGMGTKRSNNDAHTSAPPAD
jgi:hypothetical protein